MNALTVLLTDDEIGLISTEIEKLYSFQDRPLAKEKKAYLVQEISSHNYPFKAIIQGIRGMFSEELRAIKLASILDSIREQIEPSTMDKQECVECDGTGRIIMVDDRKYESLFACNCPNGNRYFSQGLVRWCGDNVQIARGVTHRIPERLLRKKWIGKID